MRITERPLCVKTINVLRRVAKRRKQIVIAIAISLLIVSTIVTVRVITTYLHFAAIVEARLADRSFMQPAGVYAAPGRVGLGQHIKLPQLVDRLLRAGYRDKTKANEFAMGIVTIRSDLVEVRTNDFAVNQELPATVRISLRSDEIIQIENSDTGEKLKVIHLPAEMLTADINAKKQTREAIRFDELPDVLVKAVSSIEDRRFFAHRGVDLGGIARAIFKNVSNGRVTQGGSTITQQLVKSQFLGPERTYRRKFAEVLMAIAIERRLTKEQIFALYCSRIYLGHSGNTSIYGFKRAARIYFGKDLRDLSLSEVTCLAGLAQAPNRYALHSRPDLAIARRDVVLDAMADAGKISKVEAAAAKGDHLVILPPEKLDDTAAPHFVDYVKREMSRHQFEDGEWPHLRIETTLDLDLQQAANQAVSKHLVRLTKVAGKGSRGVSPEVALVALDPHSGEILAMVGGRDYASSQLNRATDAMRQPGSVFKPIVYAAALSRGISPSTTFLNARQEISYGYQAVYRPENFGRSYSNRQVTLREGIVRSLNVVTVEAAMRVGLGRVAQMAERVGLPRPEIYPSMALGAFEATPLDVARAYTAFANSGVRVDPLAIRAIKNNDEVLVTCATSKEGVLPSTFAYLVTDTLADVVNRGTAASIRSLGYRGPAAGKTGTSRDAWFVGYTPNLLVVVWVGHDDNHDLRLTGSQAAVPIWTDFVIRALQLRPDLAAESFIKPSGLATVEIDLDSGMLANGSCPRRQRMLMSSSHLPGSCFDHQASLTAADYEELDSDTPIPVESDFVELPVVSTTELKSKGGLLPMGNVLMPPAASVPKPTPIPPTQ